MAWLSGWSYRKEITITGQSGAGTNYQVDLDIGASAGGDFHLEGHCTNFPQDIEVTDNDGTTLLKFWIEDITADPLIMTVKVADDLGSNQTIYVYYGKSGATTNSDIEATMMSGNDFSTDLTGWSEQLKGSGMTTSISGGELSLVRTGDPSGSANIQSVATYTNGIILEYRMKKPDGDEEYAGVSLGSGTLCDASGGTSDWWLTTLTSSYNWCYQDGVSPAGNEIYEMPASGARSALTSDDVDYGTITGYKKYGMAYDTSGNLTWFVDDVSQSTVQDTTWLNDAKKFLVTQGSYAATGRGGTQIIDWVRIRKYMATEPAFSSAGSEETPPTGVSPTAVFYGPLVGPLGGPI